VTGVIEIGSIQNETAAARLGFLSSQPFHGTEDLDPCVTCALPRLPVRNRVGQMTDTLSYISLHAGKQLAYKAAQEIQSLPIKTLIQDIL
jgi:hypothetical protein